MIDQGSEVRRQWEEKEEKEKKKGAETRENRDRSGIGRTEMQREM